MGDKPPLYELSNYSFPREDAPSELLAWRYVMPVPGCPQIEQLVCVFDEKVETEIDGVVETPPATKWTTGSPDRYLV